MTPKQTPIEKAIAEMLGQSSVTPEVAEAAIESLFITATLEMLALEWRKQKGIETIINVLCNEQREPERLRALVSDLVTQSWIEGAYTGRTSHLAVPAMKAEQDRVNTAVRNTVKRPTAEPEVERSAAAQYARLRDAAVLAGWDGVADLAKWIEGRGFA